MYYVYEEAIYYKNIEIIIIMRRWVNEENYFLQIQFLLIIICKSWYVIVLNFKDTIILK